MAAQDTPFACPAGKEDMMKYFVMSQELRTTQYLKGATNSIYTKVFPNFDFSPRGYWFWLKSAAGNGFDVKAFDGEHIFMRSTELVWTRNTSFKRFVKDLPIATRCVPQGQPGPQIRVRDTQFRYFDGCRPYKSSNLGTSVNDLDAPQLMDAGGTIGQAWTRVLHYRYNCDQNLDNCVDEEQFFLGNGWGLWQWKHFRKGSLAKTTTENHTETGNATGGLPCPDSYNGSDNE